MTAHPNEHLDMLNINSFSEELLKSTRHTWVQNSSKILVVLSLSSTKRDPSLSPPPPLWWPNILKAADRSKADTITPCKVPCFHLQTWERDCTSCICISTHVNGTEKPSSFFPHPTTPQIQPFSITSFFLLCLLCLSHSESDLTFNYRVNRGNCQQRW